MANEKRKRIFKDNEGVDQSKNNENTGDTVFHPEHYFGALKADGSVEWRKDERWIVEDGHLKFITLNEAVINENIIKFLDRDSKKEKFCLVGNFFKIEELISLGKKKKENQPARLVFIKNGDNHYVQYINPVFPEDQNLYCKIELNGSNRQVFVKVEKAAFDAADNVNNAEYNYINIEKNKKLTQEELQRGFENAEVLNKLTREVPEVKAQLIKIERQQLPHKLILYKKYDVFYVAYIDPASDNKPPFFKATIDRDLNIDLAEAEFVPNFKDTDKLEEYEIKGDDRLFNNNLTSGNIRNLKVFKKNEGIFASEEKRNVGNELILAQTQRNQAFENAAITKLEKVKAKLQVELDGIDQAINEDYGLNGEKVNNLEQEKEFLDLCVRDYTARVNIQALESIKANIQAPKAVIDEFRHDAKQYENNLLERLKSNRANHVQNDFSININTLLPKKLSLDDFENFVDELESCWPRTDKKNELWLLKGGIVVKSTQYTFDADGERVPVLESAKAIGKWKVENNKVVYANFDAKDEIKYTNFVKNVGLDVFSVVGPVDAEIQHPQSLAQHAVFKDFKYVIHPHGFFGVQFSDTPNTTHWVGSYTIENGKLNIAYQALSRQDTRNLVVDNNYCIRDKKNTNKLKDELSVPPPHYDNFHENFWTEYNKAEQALQRLSVLPNATPRFWLDKKNGFLVLAPAKDDPANPDKKIANLDGDNYQVFLLKRKQTNLNTLWEVDKKPVYKRMFDDLNSTPGNGNVEFSEYPITQEDLLLNFTEQGRQVKETGEETPETINQRNQNLLIQEIIIDTKQLPTHCAAFGQELLNLKQKEVDYVIGTDDVIRAKIKTDNNDKWYKLGKANEEQQNEKIFAKLFTLDNKKNKRFSIGDDIDAEEEFNDIDALVLKGTFGAKKFDIDENGPEYKRWIEGKRIYGVVKSLDQSPDELDKRAAKWLLQGKRLGDLVSYGEINGEKIFYCSFGPSKDGKDILGSVSYHEGNKIMSLELPQNLNAYDEDRKEAIIEKFVQDLSDVYQGKSLLLLEEDPDIREKISEKYRALHPEAEIQFAKNENEFENGSTVPAPGRRG